MSDEKTELALAKLPSVPAELESAFINDEFIDGLIKNIRAKASSVVGDINTAKGRGVYISMSANVRSTKVMIDDAGKDLVAEMKKRPALVDASRRKVREALDALAVEIRQPVTDWEVEQERIKAEKAMNAMQVEANEMNEEFDRKKLARFEADHEIALLMNDKFDRDLADKKAEEVRQAAILAEQKKKEAEEREAAIRREAEEKAKRDAEAKAQEEIDAANQREAALKAKAEQAERDRIALELKAEEVRQAAAEKAEREKQEAIESERRKAQEEADRIKRESEAKEAARIAEEKRIKEEADRRAADVENRRAVNQLALTQFIDAGIPEECAKKCISVIAKGLITPIQMKY